MKKKYTIYFFLIIGAFIGLSIVLTILLESKKNQIEQAGQLIVQEASSHYKNIKELEIWHNKFGGIFKNTHKENEYFFNIYSLKPKNKLNRAEGFAKEGLTFFQNNLDKDIYYTFKGDFQFIGALRTKQSCIQCHNDFKIDDIRGGIEVQIPLHNYHTAVSTIKSQYTIFYFLIIGFFFFTVGALLYLLHKMFTHKEQVEELNATLEQKVIERTKEVNKLYNKEHYLKSLLETIGELNQSLIETYSINSILKTSLKKLKHHPNYKLVIFGHFDKEEYFHIKYNFGDLYHYFTKESYHFKELQKQPIALSLTQAVLKKHWVIDENINHSSNPSHTSRQNDYKLYSTITLPLIDREDKKGFDCIFIATDRQEGFDKEEISILDTVSKDIKMALSAYKQRKLTEHLQHEQITNYEETILAFVDMIEQRDAYTAGHTLRVAKYSRLLAKEIGIDEQTIQKIEKAAILHDIGKIATPDTILLKPGRLNKLEYNLIKNHVAAGYKMLSKVKMYSDLAEIMKYHHEHYDGTGYPYHLKGDEIPIEAHIMIVADAFDAMTTNRIYKGRLSVEEALYELEKNNGTQFHPDIVQAALKSLKHISIHQTTQMPKNDLEKQRFSYFFNDYLTGLYNESYLELLLHEKQENFYGYLIKTKHFAIFNKEYGWNKGNELLKLVSNELRSYFKERKIFRIEGDDFLILNPQNQKPSFDIHTINLSSIDPKNIITFQDQLINVFSEEDFINFKKLLHLEAYTK
jgi:two-component system, LuxR family, sensor histidine kinase TtrS